MFITFRIRKLIKRFPLRSSLLCRATSSLCARISLCGPVGSCSLRNPSHNNPSREIPQYTSLPRKETGGRGKTVKKYSWDTSRHYEFELAKATSPRSRCSLEYLALRPRSVDIEIHDF